MLPLLLLLLATHHAQLAQALYTVCEPRSVDGRRVLSITTRQSKGKSFCMGCDELRNCSTVLGSLQFKGVVLNNDAALKQELTFPRLKEITGHLIVTFLGQNAVSVGDILPNLAVIHGTEVDLFKDYALVVYQNAGLRYLGLNALTMVRQGGIKIESNTNLCYLDTVRWPSLMPASAVKYDLAIKEGNSNDCFEKCRNCSTPSGHGSSGIDYCWGGGHEHCQTFCWSKCGSSGCVVNSQTKCCHSECLGGCTKAGSTSHCHACRNLRLRTNGTCVPKCPDGLKEVHGFYCSARCHGGATLVLDGKCVDNCPAGYTKNSTTRTCDKCLTDRCPRVCHMTHLTNNHFVATYKVSSLSDAAKLRGCTVIDGALEIELRNIRGGSNIAHTLNRDLGSIEEVHGYVVVRQSNSLISLNFFKNIRKIQPKVKGFSGKRYGLVIFDNPNLESLWDFHPNLVIMSSVRACPRCGVLVQLNPQLCLHKVYPLIDDILKWNRTDPNESRVDISKTTNGNSRTCDVHIVNITITETAVSRRCPALCVTISWPNKVKDHRNVLLYSIWYRETTSQDISEYDDIDACSSEHVWKRQDVYLAKTTQEAGKTISQTVGGLSAFKLYAFRLEAFVIANKGVKSDIAYFRTKQTKPSAPLSLEVSFLSSNSLQVKWLAPFFPNGNITHYVIRYHESNSSFRWSADINWCQNQHASSFDRINPKDTGDTHTTDGDKTCVSNVTCDCDQDGGNKDRKELEPYKKAALFSIEFQDLILSHVFSKNDDDDDDNDAGGGGGRNDSDVLTPNPTGASTVQTRENNTSSETPGPCGNNTDNSSCPTSAPSGTTSPRDIDPSKKVPQIRVFETNTTKEMIILPNLRYFTEYSVEVCACNSGAGCATNKGFRRQCAVAVGRTGKNVSADNIGNTLSYSADNKTLQFILTWEAPMNPNGVILRYDVAVQLNKTVDHYCVLSPKTQFRKNKLQFGRYVAKVRAITPVGNGSWSNIVSFDIVHIEDVDKGVVDQKEDVELAAIVGISFAAIVIVMVAFAVLMYFYMHKRFQKAKEAGVIYASVNPEYMNCSEVYVADEWEVPRDRITLLHELGNGSFGMVYEGEARGILPGEQCCKVAIKTVCDSASLRDKIEFLKEASIMKAFNCNHVVRLLGVVSAGQPALVVMELMENGDLKSFLRKRRPDEVADDSKPILLPPTEDELLQMAAEIADGMAYLSDRKFVHRDLAARNCMVSDSFTCKIGDFGMARDVYETDYYRKGGKGFLPVRWMAPESLKDGIFSSASDVWSYGVVLWEMVTLAEQPYQGKSNEEVMKYVIDGATMACPACSSQNLANIMMNCWRQKPNARPTFQSIVGELEQFVNATFLDTSFYHNRARDTPSSCVSATSTEQDGFPVNDSPPIPPITDPDARESFV